MKNSVIIGIISLVAMVLIPLGAVDASKIDKTATALAHTPDIPYINDTSKAVAYESFRILESSTGKINEIPAMDYIVGVVSAEMPALYEKEALKAQAVAAYTYACRRKDAAKKNDYDLSDNPSDSQGYVDKETARGKWGDKADEYEQKITDAAESVLGQMLIYDGTAALTVYHAISSGRTNSAADVWGKEIPYLVSVDSVGDKTAEKYITNVSIDQNEVKNALKDLAELDEKPQNWFLNLEVTGNKTVKNVCIGKDKISGSKIASLLKLRSACFEVSYSSGVFNFSVKGYGHGVGMSQNGADYMAKQGSSYKEILAWYYPGCQLKN